MNQSNIGGLKGLHIRDHIFVVNAVLQEAIKKKNSVDIQIVDIKKCFDKMNYEVTANDLFRASLDDDKFLVTVNANKINNVAIKIPGGDVTKLRCKAGSLPPLNVQYKLMRWGRMPL